MSDPSSDLWSLQKRLIPTLIIICTVFIGVFFIATIYLMFGLNERIEQNPPILSTSLQKEMYQANASEGGAAVLDNLNKFELESGIINKRYHQANVLLMSRIWNSYLGFITGIILAVIGAYFILIKLQESSSTLSGEASSVKWSIASSSPGIIFGVLGTLLMITTILNQNKIQIEDSPLYYKTSSSYRSASEIKDSLDLKKPSNNDNYPQIK